MVATGTRIPAATLAAPQTMASGSAAPTSTAQTWSLAASGWGSTDSTRPTSTPLKGGAAGVTASTSRPAMLS